MQKINTIIIPSLILSILGNSIPSFAHTTFKKGVQENIYKTYNDPIEKFSFDELMELSMTSTPQGPLKEKLDGHLGKVFTVNRKFDEPLNKPYVRVAHWNVERGFNIEDVANILSNHKKYEQEVIGFVKKRHKKNFQKELETLYNTDVISINELDIGLPRTNYKNNLKEVADRLGWNYAYATEFVEVGDLYSNKIIDKNRYEGLHGTAILSKYPIISSRVFRLPMAYDWYTWEAKKHLSPLEHARKFTASAVFKEHLTRKEVRHGGRCVLLSDIKLPNGKVFTVVTTHLEDRAFPDVRLNQFKALLDQIKDIKNPVILTGDFNTSTTDSAPTSVNKEVFKRLRDPDYIARTVAASFIPGVPFVISPSCIVFSKLIQYKDPFYPHIPIIFPNHERKFYAAIKDFKFSDGAKFDLSGDRSRSSNGRRGLLANSNQRHWKGFKSTYKLEEPRIIAYFKLDWFFIKPEGEIFKPFNGRTLKTLNLAREGGVSDHNPITVDLELVDGTAENLMKEYKNQKLSERKRLRAERTFTERLLDKKPSSHS